MQPNEAFSTLPSRHVKKIRTAIEGAHPEWTSALLSLRERLGNGVICAVLGERGTGKTQLGVCLCWYASRQERGFRYVTAYELFSTIKETYRDDAQASEAKMLRQLTSPSLLVIDEINEVHRTSWEGHVLTHLIDKRYAAEKDTILLGNYTREEFDQQFSKSILSRMEECGGYIICRWESFRKGGP